MLKGLMMAIIASVIGAMRFANRLKQCRVDKETFSGETFFHKGKFYDREKYIRYRQEILCDYSDEQLRKEAIETENEIRKGRNVELNQAELDAINRLFLPYDHQKTVSNSTAPKATNKPAPAIKTQPELNTPTIENQKHTEKTVVFCTKCGFELLENSVFCSRCGENVVIAKNAEEKAIANAVVASVTAQNVSVRSTTLPSVITEIECRKKKRNKGNIFKNKPLVISLTVILLAITAAGSFFVRDYSLYRKGISAMESKAYSLAKEYFDRTIIAPSYFSSSYRNEYAYVQAQLLYENGHYIEAVKIIEDFKDIEDINGSKEFISSAKNKVYTEAVKEYEEKDYREAKRLFGILGSYLRSEDYILLIEAHNNPLDYYDELVNVIGFEDTNTLLVQNSDVAEKFLKGIWKENQSAHPYYFTMKIDGSIEYNIPCNIYGDKYYIENGVVYIGVNDASAKKAFRIYIEDEDTIIIYSFENSKSYKLHK